MKKIIKNTKENFYTLLDNLFFQIEDILNLYENEIDIDYEIQDYVMTITFSNKSLIIINKQEFLQQIWLATKTNGYHFNYRENKWICNRTKKDFWEIFENAFFMQSNKKIFFYKNNLIKK